MRPLSNRVIVKPNEETTTKTGLYLPSSALGTVQQGTVLAVGNGAVTMSGDIIPMEVSVGDVVMFPKDQGIEIKFNDETVYLFRETDLYCVL